MRFPRSRFCRAIAGAGARISVPADQQLPEQVDPEQHSDLLSNLG